MRISAKNKICVVIGDPIEFSLSPKMHNAAYEKLGIDNEFVFIGARVKVEDIKDVVQAARVMNIRGLSCTMPHKIEILKYLDWIDPVADKIGAVNTVVNDEGVLKGYNTDWLGTIIPLANELGKNMEERFLEGIKVAMVGAGGAARAMVFGVVEKGADLKIYNRTVEKAEELAREIGCKAGGLDQLEEIKNADIIINATSLGMQGENEGKTPILKEYLSSKHIVFDAVYIPYETQLLKDAKDKGAKIIHGIDMLLHQGTAQFEYYTGYKAPKDVMRSSLLNHFGIEI